MAFEEHGIGAGPVDAAADCSRRQTCRVCGASGLELILSLGPTPLANAFLRSSAEFAAERSYPLDLYWCGRCTLLQLLDVVRPEVLFRQYLYVTGTSTTQAAHNRRYAQALADRLSLGPQDLVVEVASNDGTLLRCFAARGVRTLGVEPARNLAAEANAAGIETVADFFTPGLARTLRAERGPARAVVANNVLAHVDDPRGFLEGCRELVTGDGLVVIEVPYAGDLLEAVEYDTIYHEHLSYFSIAALIRLAEAADLRAVRLDRLPVHGGSIRLYLSRGEREHAPGVLEMEARERCDGLAAVGRYRRFAAEVEESRAALLDVLERLATDGREVAGYGAPAKGNTLLNFCRIDTRLLRYAVDKNPRKVGLFTPGAHLPVRDVSVLASAAPPDYLLILAWNLAEEIMREQDAYRARGGRFIIPVPRARVA